VPNEVIAHARKIHLIDIENLCRSSMPTRRQVEAARVRYEGEVQIGDIDCVVIASARGNLFTAYLGWPGARYLARDGKDGADICLAEVILEEELPRRFGGVVVASGDGGLAPFVAYLASCGMETTVVSLSNGLSRRMRMAAHKSIVLEPELQDIA
jgi:hypothetical protein